MAIAGGNRRRRRANNNAAAAEARPPRSPSSFMPAAASTAPASAFTSRLDSLCTDPMLASLMTDVSSASARLSKRLKRQMEKRGMTRCARDTIGYVLLSGGSLEGHGTNLCIAPLRHPSTLDVVELQEPISSLQKQGGYLSWKILDLKRVTEVLEGKVAVKANGNMVAVGMYEWFKDEMEKMFRDYPETQQQFDPAYVLVDFGVPVGGALPVLPAFPPIPGVNHWVAAVPVGNRVDLFTFPSALVAVQKQSRAALVAIVMAAIPAATFLAFECNLPPVQYP